MDITVGISKTTFKIHFKSLETANVTNDLSIDKSCLKNFLIKHFKNLQILTVNSCCLFVKVHKSAIVINEIDVR